MIKVLECTRVLTCLSLSLTSVCLADDTLLWKIQKTLAGKKCIDLTHEFAPGIPRWPGFPDETRKTIYWYDKRADTMGSGFFSELFTHVGQWGTHVDPPAHFVKGLRTVDQIDPKEMVLPLAVIDVHREAAVVLITRCRSSGLRNGKKITAKFRAVHLWPAHGLVQTLARRNENGK